MSEGDGDGVVTTKNAFLNGSKEYYINGSCSGIDILHNRILNPKLFPEVIKIIVDTIDNNR